MLDEDYGADGMLLDPSLISLERSSEVDALRDEPSLSVPSVFRKPATIATAKAKIWNFLFPNSKPSPSPSPSPSPCVRDKARKGSRAHRGRTTVGQPTTEAASYYAVSITESESFRDRQETAIVYTRADRKPRRRARTTTARPAPSFFAVTITVSENSKDRPTSTGPTVTQM